MNILITGYNGFIGKNLIFSLKDIKKIFSKPIILAAIAGTSSSVSASTISTEANAYTATWGCAKCLRNSQTYIIPTTSIRGTASDNTGY